MLSANHTVPLASAEVKEKSIGDKTYRNFYLKNGMEALIVQSEKFNKSSVAVAVEVGSFEDPKTALGMAHFIEHMLFISNKKYPEPNSYFKFIESHGGSANAYTSPTLTNYMLEINHDKIFEAMDRLAQFFISPTFDFKYVEKEKSAIHNEYEGRKQGYFWRLSAVAESWYQKDHPAAKFSIGNRDTLANVTRDELVAFHKKFYSSNRMKVVVLTNKSIEETEKKVKEIFEPVENRKAKELAYEMDLYDEKKIPTVIEVKPYKDRDTLTVQFPIPDPNKSWETKPFSLITHALEDEGERSFIQRLKDLGLATGHWTYTDDRAGETKFWVQIEVTPKGVKEYQTVLKELFTYINLIKKAPKLKYLYDELHTMADADFRYREHQEGMQVASFYSAEMTRTPALEIDERSSLYFTYKQEEVDKALKFLDPQNMIVFVSHRNAQTNKKEKYFQVEYAEQKIKKEFFKSLNTISTKANFKLPEPNPYIPDNIKLITGKVTKPEPKKLLDDDKALFWFEADSRYRLPKAHLRLQLINPVVNASIQNHVLSQLYVLALGESLSAWRKQISDAGLHFDVSRNDRGLTIDIAGYSQNMPKLVEDVATKLKNIKLSEGRFNDVANKYYKGLINMTKEDAYRLALSALRSLEDKEGKWGMELLKKNGNRWDVLYKPSLKEVLSFEKSLFANAYIKGAGYGDLEEKSIKSAVQAVFTKLGAKPVEKKHRQMHPNTKYPVGTNPTYIIDMPQPNHAMYHTVQFGERTYDLNAAIRVGAGCLKSSYFYELRTNQQLGYAVFAFPNFSRQGLGMGFVIQSNTHEAHELLKRSKDWLKTAQKTLDGLPEKEFEACRTSVIKEMREEPTTISESLSALYQDALVFEEQFDYQERIAKAAEKLTHKRVKEIFANGLFAKKVAEMTSLVYKEGSKPAKVGTAIKDLAKFRSELQTF